MTEELLAIDYLGHSESLGSVWAIGETLRRVLTWAATSLRQRGVATTCKIAFSSATDRCFDWRYGTDTYQAVDVEELQARSNNSQHAVHYQATKAGPFKKLLRHLQLPANSVFVDYGSGKGRVVMLAAQQARRFKRVVGLDFSPRLCAIARRNVETFRRRVGSLAPVAILEADATAHEPSADANVFFFYNPFNEVILRQVIARIGQSLTSHPRPIWLIYGTPLHAQVIEQSGLFQSPTALSFGGMEFRVYTNFNGRVPAAEGRTP